MLVQVRFVCVNLHEMFSSSWLAVCMRFRKYSFLVARWQELARKLLVADPRKNRFDVIIGVQKAEQLRNLCQWNLRIDFSEHSQFCYNEKAKKVDGGDLFSIQTLLVFEIMRLIEDANTSLQSILHWRSDGFFWRFEYIVEYNFIIWYSRMGQIVPAHTHPQHKMKRST